MTPAEHAATELRELAARMPDAEKHRESQDWCVDCGEWVQEHGRALAERANELERKLLECNDSFDLVEARATELERDLQHSMEQSERALAHAETFDGFRQAAEVRAEQLERERDFHETALRRLASHELLSLTETDEALAFELSQELRARRDFARAALDGRTT